MAVQVGSSSIPHLSKLDQESLALLICMRGDPQVQDDLAALKMLDNAISLMIGSSNSFLANLPVYSLSSPGLVEPSLGKSPLAPRVSSIVPLIEIDTSGEDETNGFPGIAACSLRRKWV